ncbi:MAG: hypothetical protein ACOYMF_12060 [Bacteroidales bacterium]
MRGIFGLSLFEINRWTAGLLGFIPSFFFTLFMLGEGLPYLVDGKTGVIPIMAMIFFSVAGWLVAWFQFRLGGIMMMLGGLVMGVYLLVYGGEGIGWIVASFSLPFIIPGYLFFSLKKFRK